MTKKLLFFTFLFIPYLAFSREHEGDYSYTISYTNHKIKDPKALPGSDEKILFERPHVTFFYKEIPNFAIWHDLHKEHCKKLFAKFLYRIQEEQKKLKNKNKYYSLAIRIHKQICIEVDYSPGIETESIKDEDNVQSDPISIFKKKKQRTLEVSFLNDQKSLVGTMAKEGSQKLIEAFTEVIAFCSHLFSSRKEVKHYAYISLEEKNRGRLEEVRNKAYIFVDEKYQGLKLNESDKDIQKLKNKLLDDKKTYLNQKTSMIAIATAVATYLSR